MAAGGGRGSYTAATCICTETFCDAACAAPNWAGVGLAAPHAATGIGNSGMCENPQRNCDAPNVHIMARDDSFAVLLEISTPVRDRYARSLLSDELRGINAVESAVSQGQCRRGS